MMDFRLMRQLWLFLAVAEESHFGRAAKRAGLSQPPLTEHIKALEQTLGCQLFIRSRRGTRLSPSGQALLPAVRQFVRQVETLEQTMTEVVAGRSGVLRIGAITVAMVDVVPHVRAFVRQHHPAVTVLVQEIDSVEALPALEAGEIDLAFVRCEDTLGHNLASLPLRSEQVVAALPETHPLSGQGSLSLSALADEAFVMSARKINPAYFDVLVTWCQKNGFTPKVHYEVRSIASQLAYVGCGQGVALVPASTQRLAPETVKICQIREHLALPTATAIWRNDIENRFVATALAGLAGLAECPPENQPD